MTRRTLVILASVLAMLVLVGGPAIAAWIALGSGAGSAAATAVCVNAATTTCHDNLTTAGTYTYTVTPLFKTWTGTVSDVSDEVVISPLAVKPSAPVISAKPGEVTKATTASFAFSAEGALTY